MKKTILALSIAALAGCANTATIIPQPNNTYKAVAEDFTESEALKVALSSAADTCNQQFKRHVVTDTHTIYQGDTATVDLFKTALEAYAKSEGHQTNNAAYYDNAEDYRVTVTFECV